MKVLVTGGAGFIGSHVVGMLKEKGNEVAVLDDFSVGRRENVPKEVKVIVKQTHRVGRSDISGMDAIIHCSAQVSTFLSVDYPPEDFKRNALSTFSLFEACRKFNDDAKIIYTSSRSVLGNIPDGQVATEDFPYNPSTFYNVHKAYGEMLAKIYNGLYGMQFVVLRPSNVYGPRQPYWVKGWYNFISYWIKLGLENKPIPIYGSGMQVRDYTYVTDTARAYSDSLVNPQALGETFLLASGRGADLNELSDLVIRLTGSSAGKEYLPPRKGDIMRFVGNSRKAKRILNWGCEVSLEEGLREEVEWVKTKLKSRKSSQGRDAHKAI